jgi:hypothetical protein
MSRWIGSFQHQFNVGGKEKCPFCGDYFFDTAIDRHMSKCHNNPDREEDDE